MRNNEILMKIDAKRTVLNVIKKKKTEISRAQNEKRWVRIFDIHRSLKMS